MTCPHSGLQICRLYFMFVLPHFRGTDRDNQRILMCVCQGFEVYGTGADFSVCVEPVLKYAIYAKDRFWPISTFRLILIAVG